MSGPIIVWLRRDLRLADNPALHAAAASGRAVIPLLIDEPVSAWTPGAASRYWLHRSATDLAARLQQRGSRLLLRRGRPRDVLPQLVAESGAEAVYWNRRYEPAAIAADTQCKQTLKAHCEVRSFNDRLLLDPRHIATGSGTPYRVFTPFYRACLAAGINELPLPEPRELGSPVKWPDTVELSAFELLPRHNWAAGIDARWSFGETAAWRRLEDFIARALVDYPQGRDYPARDAISMLSPHLHFGEISARSICHTLRAASTEAAGGNRESAAQTWIRQLLWREFAAHLLFHFPHTSDAPLREKFDDLPWVVDGSAYVAWTRGRTGFPLVDAGMRELWHSGFMHNRVRMVVASFLCKQIGIHWLEGARWFWDTLVDADLANNTLGWQWVAGCGADAAPYFRIFNPVTQSRRFDPDGTYIRTWVAELADVAAPQIHAPGAAGYAEPMLELGAARSAALARYDHIRA